MIFLYFIIVLVQAIFIRSNDRKWNPIGHYPEQPMDLPTCLQADRDHGSSFINPRHGLLQIFQIEKTIPCYFLESKLHHILNLYQVSSELHTKKQ